MGKTMKFVLTGLMFGLGVSAMAGTPIAPVSPWSPHVDKTITQWSKMFHKHFTRTEALKETCPFPSEAEVGVKAYPGSILVNMDRGGGSANDGDDLPMVELATKAPLDKVMAWYEKHYPNLNLKFMFETPGPGVSYSTTKPGLIPPGMSGEIAGTDGRFGGCGGLLAVPENAGYQTGVQIYYQPQGR